MTKEQVILEKMLREVTLMRDAAQSNPGVIREGLNQAIGGLENALSGFVSSGTEKCVYCSGTGGSYGMCGICAGTGRVSANKGEHEHTWVSVTADPDRATEQCSVCGMASYNSPNWRSAKPYNGN